MSFPTTLPSYIITAGSDTANVAAGGTGLSPLLNAFETDITGIGTKFGTGASTPVANTLLYGTGTGTSAWQGLTSAQMLALVSDETGTGSLVFANTPTIVTPTIASFTNAQHNHSNAAGGGTIDQAGLPLGTVVQVVNIGSATVSTGTTQIPFDNTLPQITEGTEFMTLAITPKSASNVLVIEITAMVSHSAAADISGAIFQDSTANALAVGTIRGSLATEVNTMTAKHTMVAGTTSTTTFRFRVGGDVSGTLTFNGQAAAQLFSTAIKSTIVITEYKA